MARCLDQWQDMKFLWDFADDNNIENKAHWIDKISENVDEFLDFFDEVENEDVPLEEFFQPLDNLEFGFHELSKQKGKFQKNDLRLYAIKVDQDCFVITGGAIKMTLKMKDHPDTLKELPKIERARIFLKEIGITDIEGLNDFLNDE